MLNFRTPRARPVFQKAPTREKGSFTRILYGLLFIGLGLVFIIANANPAAPYKEVSGNILDLYEHTLNGHYDSNWLHISTDAQELYIFDKNALQPAWNNLFFKKEHIDIYYVDGTPKRVIAFQLYNPMDDPYRFYTTAEYQSLKQSTPASYIENAGIDIVAVLSLIGVLTISFAVYHMIQNSRRKSDKQAETFTRY